MEHPIVKMKNQTKKQKKNKKSKYISIKLLNFLNIIKKKSKVYI